MEHWRSINKELERLTKNCYLIFVVKRAWKVLKFREEWQASVLITVRTKTRCTNWRKDSKEGRTVVLKAHVLQGSKISQIWNYHCCLYEPSCLWDMALCSPVEISISEVRAFSIFYNKAEDSSFLSNVDKLVLTVTCRVTSQYWITDIVTWVGTDSD
jgi:hypothetical protein